MARTGKPNDDAAQRELEAGLRELDEALARWEISVDEHGRIRTADIREAVKDGRIKPTPGSPVWLKFSDL